MRIFILGDLQYGSQGRDDIQYAFEDINELKANDIIFLGDYGSRGNLGSQKLFLRLGKLQKAFMSTVFFPFLGITIYILKAATTSSLMAQWKHWSKKYTV